MTSLQCTGIGYNTIITGITDINYITKTDDITNIIKKNITDITDIIDITDIN